MDNAGIVIIGGGIVGSSVAYHLSSRGADDVVLIERMDLASAASSKAAGLMFQISSKPAIDRLSREVQIIGQSTVHRDFRRLIPLLRRELPPRDFENFGIQRFYCVIENLVLWARFLYSFFLPFSDAGNNNY